MPQPKWGTVEPHKRLKPHSSRHLRPLRFLKFFSSAKISKYYLLLFSIDFVSYSFLVQFFIAKTSDEKKSSTSKVHNKS